MGPGVSKRRTRSDQELGQTLFDSTAAPGLVEAGNIDLKKQPRVKNKDGTTSTVRSMSINEDGVEILIPTVAHDGKGILNDRDAITQWHTSKKHLGKFRSVKDADRYAKRLHESYERGELEP